MKTCYFQLHGIGRLFPQAKHGRRAGRIILLAGLLLLLTIALQPGAVHAQSADDGFNPDANSTVYALAQQADGKIVVGGQFTTMGGVTRNRIARLNPDGSLDTTFNPDANNPVFTLALQADGKIVVGGFFTTMGGVGRNCIA